MDGTHASGMLLLLMMESDQHHAALQQQCGPLGKNPKCGTLYTE
jgi:hypothetical protein